MQQMTLIFSIAVIILCLAGLLLLAGALRRLRRGRLLGGGMSLSTGLLAWLAAALLLAIAFNLRTYTRLTHEAPVATIKFKQLASRRFEATLTRMDGVAQQVRLDGDEWQLDARIIKWRGFAALLGLDTRYRLERLSGRYADISAERQKPHTVAAVSGSGGSGFDFWAFSMRHAWVPWVDARYGSATYLPMADGAEYLVSISNTGLLARPVNQPARDAVGHW